ncbi:MAG: hypothetical protein DYG91_03805 [Chloroflexi bacterium CFX7]|nr:hypothetical protein [Chloroflexi bacterium CFX7]RIL03831.1 MAG: hypothetical protein DCC78_03500 [bacterium]
MPRGPRVACEHAGQPRRHRRAGVHRARFGGGPGGVGEGVPPVRAPARPAAAPLRPGGLDPLRFAWQLLTNVKFALLLVGLAGVAGLVGVVVPQVPAPMRGNPAARAAWLEAQRADYGAFTDPFDRLELFDVFHSWWFTGLWALIIVAVTVCTVSRFLPTWRSVHRPPKAVAGRFFETAHHRANFSHAGGTEAIEKLLVRRRYRVEHVKAEDSAEYLFAERFAWSHYGTFLSHLALLMLLVGGLLTVFAGFDRTLVIAETTPAAPIFDDPGPGQIFVRVLDSVRGIDPQGNIVDYRTLVEVRRGDRTERCTTTVNDPCSAFGYRVHQAAFFDDIGRLHVAAPDGRVLYDDVIDFENRTTAVPWLRVTDRQGNVVFDEETPQAATEPGESPGPEDDVALGAAEFPAPGGGGGFVSLPVAWRVVDGELRVLVLSESAPGEVLSPGMAAASGEYRIEFREARSIPAMRIDDMPGALPGDGTATVQMLSGRDGRPYLFVSGIDSDNVELEVDQPARTPGGFTYTFGGRVEAAGLSVRRDPGDTFIWIAVGMALAGLSITFYVPRRRLWVKVTPSRTYVAGMAERTTRFGRELRLMGAELGARDALLPGDTEKD